MVQTTMMDVEFDKLKNLLAHVALNTTAAREHVGEIKQKIRVIKERARGTINTLPYKKLPRLMVIELLHFCIVRRCLMVLRRALRILIKKRFANANLVE